MTRRNNKQPTISHISNCIRAGLNTRLTKEQELRWLIEADGLRSFPQGSKFKRTVIDGSEDVGLMLENA